MEFIIYLTLFVISSFCSFLLYEMFYTKKTVLKERLNHLKRMGKQEEEDEDELGAPFMERVIHPMYQRFIQAIGNATPAAIKTNYEELILSIGTSKNLSFNNVIAIQLMLSLLIAGLAYLYFQSSEAGVSIMKVVFAGIAGFILPYLYLRSLSEKRKEEITVSLPSMLDLLYVSVEAGLGFDMALKKVSDEMHGPLSEEIQKTLNEILTGRSREEALRSLARRTRVSELSAFVTAVIQSEQLGSNVTNMLKIQAITMRQTKRQRAQEKAAKIPTKMMFPLVLFMFPALFVVILGPAIISMMETLMN